jgi:DnaK suppressor protein
MAVMSGLPDKKFIDQQRRRLIELRTQLQGSVAGTLTDEQQARDASVGMPADSADDARRLAQLELDDNVVVHIEDRLAQIDRALQKIDAGTYGVSDVSGEPIPIPRLMAIPEATRTVDEEAATKGPGLTRAATPRLS